MSGCTFESGDNPFFPASGIDLTKLAYSIDRNCRRLGYAPVIRQRLRRRRRSGSASAADKYESSVTGDFVSVPTLLQNCAALLALLESGPQLKTTEASLETQLIMSYAAPKIEPRPQPPLLERLDSNINSSSVQKPAKSSRWKRLLDISRSRLTKHKAPVVVAYAEDESEASSIEAVDAAPVTMPANQELDSCNSSAPNETGKMTLHLQQLLADVRRGAEKLCALAGDSSAGDTDENANLPDFMLTPLQKEVLYFQMRWPQAMQTVMDKMTESQRMIAYLTELSAARSRAEIANRARGTARLASMEAELLRLRKEIRLCGRHRSAQKAAPAARARRQVNDTQQAKSKPSTVTLAIEQKRQSHRLNTSAAEAVPITTDAPENTFVASLAGDFVDESVQEKDIANKHDQNDGICFSD